MTSKQYKRLLIVSILPLLLAGVIFAAFIRPPSQTSYRCSGLDEYIDCEPFDEGFPGKEWGRLMQDGWFMVRPSAHHKDFSASYYFYFEPRVQRVKIAKANLFASSATVKSETLLGRRALLSLKTTGTSRGSFAPEDMSWVHLVCDSLQLNKDPDLYSCSGGGDDWFGNFVLTDDEGSLEQVHAVVVGEIKKSEGALIIRSLLGFVTPLCFFLLLSFLTWALMRAYKYVKTGG